MAPSAVESPSRCNIAPTATPSDPAPANDTPPPSPMWLAVHRAIQSLGHLSNFLPTGTALIFQFLLPIVSEGGKCPALADRYMTAILLALLGVFCFAMSFTDTYTAPDGSRYYGIATPRGLWIPAAPTPDIAAAAANAPAYRLRFSDFVHGSLSVVVFAASSLFDPDVKDCFRCSFLPASLQSSLPVVIAFFASLVLLIFPSSRHGFDDPPYAASGPSLPASTPTSWHEDST